MIRRPVVQFTPRPRTMRMWGVTLDRFVPPGDWPFEDRPRWYLRFHLGVHTVTVRTLSKFESLHPGVVSSW